MIECPLARVCVDGGNTDWLDLLLRRRVLTFSFIRQLATEEATFEGAVARAAATPLAAASYIVLGGAKPGEGALITRGRDGSRNATAHHQPMSGGGGGHEGADAAASSPADVMRLDAAAGRWYLLETNYDHDKPPDAHDDRRAVATRALARHGRPADARRAQTALLAVLSDNGHCNATRGERPVLNARTVYTAAVVAARPEGLSVVLRDPPAVDNCSE